MKHFSLFKCVSNGGYPEFWKRKANVVFAIKCSFLLMGPALCSTDVQAFSQNVRYDSQPIELSHVLKDIEQHTGYVFFYKSTDIKGLQVYDFSLKNKSVEVMLKELATKIPIQYTIKGKTIALNKVSAAQKAISGQVKDAQGMPLPGVSIMVKGTARGTSSDTNGNFTLEVSAHEVIVFRAVGYEILEIAAANPALLSHVVLQQQPQELEELVVIGYGKVNRKNVSGAVASVKGSDLSAVSTSSNFTQSLQGKAAGLQVLQGTGQPGASSSVKIRSNPSNASAGVLYVVDGVPINGGASTPNASVSTQSNQDISPLNFINSNDIESIEVLKDAASASIYGARAGAGVILITTKRGQSGAPKINYTGSYGFQSPAKMYEVLDTRTYMQQVNMIDRERWMLANKIGPYYGKIDASTLPPFSPRYSDEEIKNTPIKQNAMDAISRNGYTTQHNVSLAGGTDKTKYFVSGNYFDQKGILIATGMRRYNFRANFDQHITDRIKTGISATMSDGVIKATGTGGAFENGGILTAALYHPANMDLVNPDGTFPLNPRYANIPNPLSYETVLNDVKNFRLLTNAYLSWEVMDGLTAKGMYSFDRSTSGRELYLPRTYLGGAKTNGNAQISQNEANIKLLEYTLNYDKTIAGDHRIGGLLGYSFNHFNTKGLSAGNQNFPTDALYHHNLGTGQSPKPSVGSESSEKTIASYFARGIYTFKNRYTLQASVRRDGASNFAENKKWGYFPGVAANWVMSDEAFMQTEGNPINFLKWRLSYGQTGNSDIQSAAQLAYSTSYSEGNYSYLFGDGASPSTGFGIARLNNPDLSWETASEINAGLDFGLFHDRITGSVDYFSKTISGLLFNVTTPGTYEINVRTVNAGKTQTDGYEIALQTKNIIDRSGNKGFTWSTTINFSHYLSYWKERAPQTMATLARYVVPTGRDAVYNAAYGYLSSGIYDGQGNAPAHMADMLPGSLMLSDLASYDQNGNLAAPDGRITAADQTLLANLDPKFNFGFGNTFTFKDFDLQVFFSGAIMKAWSPYGPNRNFRIASLAANMGTYGWNTMPVSLERWTFENPTGSFPTGLSDAKYASYQNNSSYWMVNANFLRCRNITLGYSCPTEWLAGQQVIKGVRLSFDVQNPFTITKYPGLDPELNQNNYYPLAKSYVLGVNVSF